MLFDLPHVVANAESALAAAGVAERCTRVGGDFFEGVPQGADAYVLAQVVHDRDDERCVTILHRCREAARSDSTLLVVELVLPPSDEPFFGKWVDLHMLVMASGRERTTSEYEALLRAGGFRMTQVIPTAVGVSLVEAVPA